MNIIISIDFSTRYSIKTKHSKLNKKYKKYGNKKSTIKNSLSEVGTLDTSSLFFKDSGKRTTLKEIRMPKGLGFPFKSLFFSLFSVSFGIFDCLRKNTFSIEFLFLKTSNFFQNWKELAKRKWRITKWIYCILKNYLFRWVF